MSEFWYFVSTDNSLEYLGHWMPADENSTAPDWWVDAKHNWYDFWLSPFRGGAI
jgi:hypothetical protein